MFDHEDDVVGVVVGAVVGVVVGAVVDDEQLLRFPSDCFYDPWQRLGRSPLVHESMFRIELSLLVLLRDGLAYNLYQFKIEQEHTHHLHVSQRKFY